MWLSPSLKRLHGLVPAYRESLSGYSPFYLVLELFVIAALGFYRMRAGALLGGISPDLVSGEGYGAYFVAALSTDTLATALVMTVLAGAWLLTPILKKAAAVLSLIAVFAYSSFMVFAADFLRIYQTAFGKGYLAGEHFTGIDSMFISARAELSSVSRSALIVLTALLVSSSIATLRRGTITRTRAVFLAKKASSLAATLALAACLLSSSLLKNGAEGKAPALARIQGLEVGRNPASAFLFGPGRETFKPPASEKAVPAHYNTDSLEKAGASRPLPSVAKGRYNVILYFCESTSWRYYDLEYHGRPVLPVMHLLARNGLLLKNHYATYPLSAHTLYSVLSSRYPVYGKSSIFREYHDVDVHTLPEVLSENGYSTCFIHTGDLLYASRNKFLANRNIGTFILYKDLVKDERYRKKVGWGADERSMIRPAVEWIKAQSSPFFLMMAPVNPHHPYAIPEDIEKIADPGEEGIGESEKHWRNYLNSLHYADAAMGQLVETLEREGLMRNTVFVMVTDHGEAFYQHPRNYNHPLFIYEENVHVPALFYSKSLFPVGTETESITRHVDIMPSILDLIGVKDATRRDGESILSLSKEKMAVFHTSWNDEFMGVRDGRWKYIQRMKDSREELYDLEADPGEKVNIAQSNPSLVSRYREVSADMVSYMLEQYRSVARKH
jgi:arylsulfatase A-like enzyme